MLSNKKKTHWGWLIFTQIPRGLTLALLACRLTLSISIETFLAALAVVALCVSQTFQTLTSDAVTYSHRIEVHVAVAVTRHTRSSPPAVSQRISIVTVFAHLTACSCVKSKGERDEQGLDGWLSRNTAGVRVRSTAESVSDSQVVPWKDSTCKWAPLKL